VTELKTEAEITLLRNQIYLESDLVYGNYDQEIDDEMNERFPQALFNADDLGALRSWRVAGGLAALPHFTGAVFEAIHESSC